VIETQAPPPPQRSRAGLAVGIVLLVFAVLGALITVIIQADAGARAKQARRTPASHAPLDVERIAQAVADKRAKALLAGDEQGWLADLDPAASDLIAGESSGSPICASLRRRYSPWTPRTSIAARTPTRCSSNRSCSCPPMCAPRGTPSNGTSAWQETGC
jgi:hypothetical protein